MTNTQVKTQIDTDITNKTSVKSISPLNVGSNIKKVIDYIDQEVKIKILKITITESQILQLFTTPITILDSTEAGKVKYPTNVYIKRNTGTAYTLATTSFSVINDLNTVMSGNLNPNPLANTDGYFQSEINVVQNLSGGYSNAFYKLRANSGNPTGGTGDIDVYVTYVEITL